MSSAPNIAITCPTCKGEGYMAGSVQCTKCLGSGKALAASYREVVEAAGGIFVGIQTGGAQDMVLFQGEIGGSTISLYLSACRSVADVEMAIKSKREQMARKQIA